MKTILIVDGYNAINAVPEARDALKKGLRSARSAIMKISKEYARSSGYITGFRVVFDGIDKYRRLEIPDIPKGKTQIFSGTGEGDEKIIEVVKKCSKEGKVVLASNDNYVRNNARAYGAALVDVKELSAKKQKRSGARSKKISKRAQKEITSEYKKKLGI